MSTRSGKRIHSYFHEDTAPTDQEAAVKSERKTRSKRLKENLEEFSVSLFKNKKRNNYVSYPTDDELLGDIVTRKDEDIKSSRVLRKNALKEQNPVAKFENLEIQTDAKNLIRKSRHGKKLPDDAEETENHENIPVEVMELPKSRKSKKKKKVNSVIDNPPPAEEEVPAKKSKKKKKKGKKTNSIVIEDVEQNDNSKIGSVNKSNMSIDSFHSAAGSPNPKYSKINDSHANKLNTTFDTNEQKEITNSSFKTNKKLSVTNTFDKNDVSMSKNELVDVGDEINNDTFDKGSKKRNSVLKDTTFDCSDISLTKINTEKNVHQALNTSNIANGHLKRKSNLKDSTFDKSNLSATNKLDKDLKNSLNVSSKCGKRRSSLKDIKDVSLSEDMYVDEVKNNDTFDKISKNRTSGVKDATFDKQTTKETIHKDAKIDFNVFNKQLRSRKSYVKDTTFDKNDVSIIKNNLKDGEVDLSEQRKTRKSNIKDNTFDKSNASITSINNFKPDVEQDLDISNISNKQSRRRRSSVKDATFDKPDQITNTTFETVESVVNKKSSTFNKSNNENLNSSHKKNIESDRTDTSTAKRKEKLSGVNTTYDKTHNANDTTFERDISTSFDAFKRGAITRKSSMRDVTLDKSNASVASLTKEDFEKDKNIISSSIMKRKSIRRYTFDRSDAVTENVNTTYEKTENEPKRKSPTLSHSTSIIQHQLNTTFEKETEKDIVNSESKTSLISSDNSVVTDKSDISHISITSDETIENVENIVNTTLVLIESSMDESHISITKQKSPKPQTPLKREGTFTKEGPEVVEPKLETPKKQSLPIPPAGCTPFHITKSSQKRSMLNVTRSIEKGGPSVEPASRMTRVMFCSPIDNPVMATQEKRKIIKSNLKGSNKSFVFEDNVCRPARKRSYTQSDADDARAKRSRLTEDLQQSVDRLSRPRTASATGKLSVATPSKKPITPSKSKSESKVSRTKLPNFAALHQKQFDKMESLGECQERRAKRAKQLLTPTAPPGLLERISPKNNADSPKAKEPSKSKEKTDTPTKKLPTLDSLRPGFTRFGFKLNLDVNPFSIPSKIEKPKEKLVEKPNRIPPRQGVMPSLAGATSIRREVAKQAVMREKSFADKRNVNRNENRTIIKGVRTNRRFELQMKLRNID